MEAIDFTTVKTIEELKDPQYDLTYDVLLASIKQAEDALPTDTSVD